MEKKIIIKLFEEFKQDLNNINANIVSIFNELSENERSFTSDGRNVYKYNNYTIYGSSDNWKESDNFKIEFEITKEESTFDITISFIADIVRHGGHLISSETQLQPAEYEDEEYEISDIEEFHYSLYYKEVADQVNDIDYLEIKLIGDQYTAVERFINETMYKFI